MNRRRDKLRYRVLAIVRIPSEIATWYTVYLSLLLIAKFLPSLCYSRTIQEAPVLHPDQVLRVVEDVRQLLHS